MNIVIIEDEAAAANRIKKMLSEIDSNIKIKTTIESVKDGISWFKENDSPDLIIADIQLSDGLSFEIFKNLKIESYIIFITAYNDYAIEAFKLNSIDYLLKPLDIKDLQQAFNKFKKFYNDLSPKIDFKKVIDDINNLSHKNYKTRFLVKYKQAFIPVSVEDIAYFFTEDQLIFLQVKENKKYLIDHTLNDLENMLNPKQFFRINRQMIVSLTSIKTINSYFNNRLILELTPSTDFDVIVSREKVNLFKEWLGE